MKLSVEQVHPPCVLLTCIYELLLLQEYGVKVLKTEAKLLINSRNVA